MHARVSVLVLPRTLQLASSEGTIAFVAESLGQLDATTRGHMDASYLRDVLEPLQTRMGLFGPLKSQMRERELIKMDFDSRFRKVKALKASGSSGSDTAALPKKEQKLRDTAETLRTLTEAIFKTQSTVEADVFAVLGPAFSAFLRTQRRFFTVRGQGGADDSWLLPALAHPSVCWCWLLQEAEGIITGMPEIGDLRAPPLVTLPADAVAPAWRHIAEGGSVATAMTATAGAGTRSPLAGAGVPPAAATVAAPTTTAARPAGGASTGATTNPFVSAGVSRASTTTSIVGAGTGGEARGPLPPAPTATGATGGVLGSMRALYAYSPAKHDELELQAGDVVTVLERHVSWAASQRGQARCATGAAVATQAIVSRPPCRATVGARASTPGRTPLASTLQTTRRRCDDVGH